MSEFESPQESLQQYFDDLLYEEGGSPAAPLRRAAGEPQPAPQRSRAAAKPTAEIEPEHIARVAKLLQTRPLPVPPRPPAASADLSRPLTVEAGKREVAAKPALVSAPAVVESPPKAEAVAAPQPATPPPASRPELPPEPESIPQPAAASDRRPAGDSPEALAIEGLEWLQNGRPPWAQQQFEVLLLQVAGLTLAVPLVALGQIQPLTDELTPLFGQADWFMGLQPTPVGKVRTVNTAKFVMPERYDERFLQTARYVISINGLPWGLAVDSVKQPITLQPEDVNWRGQRSRRPWLAGTVKAHMCALLDVPRMGRLLLDADLSNS